MHILSFVLPRLIQKDQTENICLTFLKVEEAGERVHQIWYMLIRSRYFAVRNEDKTLYYTFLQYENLLFIDQSEFK